MIKSTKIAAKDICNFFLSLKDISAYDRKLIKSLTDEEIVSNLLNGVKLTGQGNPVIIKYLRYAIT